MTYEYECDACRHLWEQTQRISDSPLTTCPACASSRVHRVISGGTGFLLKGGGWGKDLYASNKPGVTKEKTTET